MIALILACLLCPADEPVILVRRAVDYRPANSQIGKRLTIRLRVHSEGDDFAIVQGDGPRGSIWTVRFRKRCETVKEDMVIEGRLIWIRSHAGERIDGVWVDAWEEYVVEDTSQAN